MYIQTCGLSHTDEKAAAHFTMQDGNQYDFFFSFLPSHYYARHYVCHFQQSPITSTLDS